MMMIIIIATDASASVPPLALNLLYSPAPTLPIVPTATVAAAIITLMFIIITVTSH
jgi:hypothetical protein